MSMSGVAGPSVPRNWTPIQGRRDDTAQTTATSSTDQTTGSTDLAGVPTTPFSGKIASEVTDSIMVSLPNGMKVGMFHFGGGSSGFDAQMLASLEHLADNLSAYTTTAKGTDDGKQPKAASDGSGNTASNDELQGTQALDMIHVDLPNGMSVEIRHNSPNGDADGGAAALSEMEKAMEELVDHFASQTDPSADTGPSAGTGTSQQKLAAYAEQARQRALASLIPDPGVSRES